MELVENAKPLSALNAKVHFNLQQELRRRDREARQREIQKQEKRVEQPKQDRAKSELIAQLIPVQSTLVKRKTFQGSIKISASPVLDFAFGDITELCGEPGSGKTSIVLAAVAQCVARAAQGDQLGPEAVIIGSHLCGRN